MTSMFYHTYTQSIFFLPLSTVKTSAPLITKTRSCSTTANSVFAAQGESFKNMAPLQKVCFCTLFLLFQNNPQIIMFHHITELIHESSKMCMYTIIYH